MRVATALAAVLVATQALAAGAQEPTVKSAVCSGNEPFWRLELRPDAALLMRPRAAGVVEQTLHGGFVNLHFLDPPWRVWRGHATGEPARVLVVTMRAETCFDSMSGERHDHRGLVSFFDRRAEPGCCRVALDTKPTSSADPAERAED